jgi:hypothetical protein
MNVIQIVLLVLAIQILLITVFVIGYKMGKAHDPFAHINQTFIPTDSDIHDDIGVEAPKVDMLKATKDFVKKHTMSSEEKDVAKRIEQINRIKEEELNNIMGYTGMVDGEEGEE